MFKLLYNLAMYLYRGAIAVGAVFKPAIRCMHQGECRTPEQLAGFAARRNGKVVWVHAASLGEFEQGRPLIERIKKQHPHYSVVLSFFSPSGYEVRKNYPLADLVVYLPIDTPTAARRFVDTLKPDVAYFIKYEFWLNLLSQLRRRKVPTYLVSAIFRDKQPFFRWYGGDFRRCLTTFDTIFVQDDESKRRLASIGIDRVEVVGDTRFDRVADIAAGAKRLPIVEAFARGRQVVVAGSTWAPDESGLIPYINTNAGRTRMIIAPHHVEPVRIGEITRQLTCRYALYTDATVESVADADCLIINTIGLLSSVYQYGQTAYIGGGFGVGIHNTLEAAVWGVPVVFGPNYRRFREACQLIECGAARPISSPGECASAFDRFLTDNTAAAAARHYVASHTGASDKIIADLKFS